MVRSCHPAAVLLSVCFSVHTGFDLADAFNEDLGKRSSQSFSAFGLVFGDLNLNYSEIKTIPDCYSYTVMLCCSVSVD